MGGQTEGGVPWLRINFADWGSNPWLSKRLIYNLNVVLRDQTPPHIQHDSMAGGDLLSHGRVTPVRS